MGAFNQLNGAQFDAPSIEARINALDGLGFNQRVGAALDMSGLARRLTNLDGKVAKIQGGIEFDVNDLMVRLALLEAGLFSPLSLFAAGEQGAWYDPSDFSSMFQDSAGTTPVTALGQPVGKILDKSGRGNHATQATTANRPTLQQDGGGYFYLAFNGTNSSIASSSVNLTGTAQLAAWVGLTKQSDNGGTGVLLELGTNVASVAGTFASYMPHTGTGLSDGSFSARSDTTTGYAVDSGFAAPYSLVMSGQASIGATVSLRRNGVQTASTPLSGAGNFSNNVLNIGSRQGTALFFNGRIYSLIVRGANSTAAQIAAAEKWVGQKMGIAL